jgi:hypothetical protein
MTPTLAIAAHDSIGLISLAISLITLAAMIWGQKHVVKRDYVSDLEDHVSRLQEEVKDVEKELDRARARIFQLEQDVKMLVEEKVALLARLVGVK